MTELQAEATEVYRRSPYPALIHTLTHPDRLATIARLAGLNPPDIRTARVLEIGVADGLNTLSMAQTLPHAQFVGIDIEPAGLERGRARLAKTGLTNLRLEVADLLDGAASIEGQFDYIIAHGVYAWVPEVVSEALLALIAARLTADGIAYVSFNAFPGCYARLPIRDAVLRAAAGARDDAERLERGRAVLREMAAPRPDDTPMRTGLRAVAQARLQDDNVLLHDEMGAVFRPSYLYDVIDRADAHGLKFLGDASAELVTEAFADDDLPPAQVQRLVEARACANDDATFRVFRCALLVHGDAQMTRRLEPAVVESLWAMSYADEVEPFVFKNGEKKIRCEHPPLADALRRLRAAFPARLSVRALGFDAPLLKALVGLFDFDMVSLHTVDAPWAGPEGERPAVAPLARVMVAEGSDWAANLDHRVVRLGADPIAAMALIDGSRDRAALLATLADSGIPGELALTGIANHAFLMR